MTPFNCTCYQALLVSFGPDLVASNLKEIRSQVRYNNFDVSLVRNPSVDLVIGAPIERPHVARTVLRNLISPIKEPARQETLRTLLLKIVNDSLPEKTQLGGPSYHVASRRNVWSTFFEMLQCADRRPISYSPYTYRFKESFVTL